MPGLASSEGTMTLDELIAKFPKAKRQPDGSLDELVLITKNSLKFLDAFRFSLKNKAMLSTGQSLQIANSIVSFNAIQVMNYPMFRQSFPISLFPDKDVFGNVTLFIRSWVFWFIDISIATAFLYVCSIRANTNFPALYPSTMPTSFRSIITKFTASDTGMPPISSPTFRGLFFVFAFFHTYILHKRLMKCKLLLDVKNGF